MSTAVDSQTGTRSGHVRRDAQAATAAVGAADFPDGQRLSDTHRRVAVGEHNSQPTKPVSTPSCCASAGPDLPDGHARLDPHTSRAVGEQDPPAPAIGLPPPIDDTPVLASTPWADSNALLLTLLADVLDDLERTRIASENRFRQLTRGGPDDARIKRGE